MDDWLRESQKVCIFAPWYIELYYRETIFIAYYIVSAQFYLQNILKGRLNILRYPKGKLFNYFPPKLFKNRIYNHKW